MIKKILITVMALFNLTFLSIAYSDNATFVGVTASILTTALMGQWVSVGNNLPIGGVGRIRAVTEFNGKLYAAGLDNNAHTFVSLYNGNNQNPQWTSVGNGLPTDVSYVTSLVVYKKYSLCGYLGAV